MHFHMNERIDDGRPVNNGTDMHRDCLADTLRLAVPAFALLGWEMTEWLVTDLQGTTEVTFSCEDNCENVHTIRILIWGCTCESGEHEMRQSVAHLN